MLPGFGLFEPGLMAGALTWLGFLLCLASATIQLANKPGYAAYRKATRILI